MLMFRKFFFYLALVSLVAAAGCNREEGVKEIVCDTENAVALNVLDAGIFQETALEPVPLLAPSHIEIPGDGGLYFRSNDSLYRYSLQDGRRERIYGQRGRAKNEYANIWEYWLDGDSVCIYDVNANRLLRYSRDGEWLDSQVVMATEYSFQALCRLDDEHWLAQMNFRGDPGVTPRLGIFDNDFGFCRPVGPWTLLSGTYVSYPFCRNAEGVLYNAPLSDELIQVTPDTEYVKYKIVFKDGTMKLENYENEWALLMAYDVERGRRDFSFLPQGFYEDGNYLGFRYTSSKKGPMLALYDMRKGVTHCFSLGLPEEWQCRDAVIRDGKVYLVIYGEDLGLRLMSTDIKTLLAQ